MDRNILEADQIDGTTGQARKSLWIETLIFLAFIVPLIGQARKSLWIETSVVDFVALPVRGSGS